MLFTIAICTFNRSKLLKRNLINLEKLNFDKCNFEVIIVDDGSKDDTAEFVKDYINSSDLNIIYHKKNNGGKYTAFNYAIDKANGFFYVNCDSDDYLDENCLLNIERIWNMIDISDKENIAGIIGHNSNLKTNRITGSLFPEKIIISDPIDMRFKYRIKGDKFPCIKTSILKNNKFPLETEKTSFVPESFIYYSISKNYNFFYSNKIFKYVEYQDDGLTNNIDKYRLKNAFGCFLVYEKYLELFSPEKSLKGYVRNCLNYFRFSFHSKQKFKMRRLLDFILLPFGFALYIRDFFNK